MRSHREISNLALVCLTLLLLPMASLGSAVVSLSIDELPVLLQERNQNVSGAKTLEAAAEIRTGHLMRSYLPTLTAIGGGEHFQTGRYASRTNPYGAVEARLNIFRGGKDVLENEIRRGRLQQASATARKTYLLELSEARRQFWALVYEKEVIKTLGEALKQNDKNIEFAKRRVAHGLTTKTDQVEFEINASQLREEIESQEHETLLTQMALGSILGMPLKTKFQTVESIPHEHDESLLVKKTDVTNHYEIQILKANELTLDAEAKQYRRWWMPTLDLYGGYYLYTLRDRDYLGQSLRDDTVVGLKLSVDLFDGFQSRNAAAALSLQAQGFEQQANQKTSSMEAQIEIAKEELKHIHELIHVAEKRIELGKAYLRGTIDEYNRGVKNAPDVLNSMQRYVSYQRRYIDLRRDYQVSKAGLQAVLEE